MAKKTKPTKNTNTPKRKRKYLSQSDVPSVGITQASRVVRAIADEYNCNPTAPLHVASAMSVQPKSGGFRTLCGAALAYGLTDGGPNSKTIGLTDLGKRVARPLEDGDNVAALREAFLRPRVVGEFLRKYHLGKFPRDEIAINVLKELGVPGDKSDEVLSLIKESATELELFTDINGQVYVDLSGASISSNTSESEQYPPDGTEGGDERPTPEPEQDPRLPKPSPSDSSSPKMRRVFITHGKNKAFIEPLRELLAFGDFEAVVSVERETVSKPLPQKVMDDMRSCSAAIIHVEDEKKQIDSDGGQIASLNSNVLIEIGAAMALYGQRFILLVREGVSLPSNLSGLYEVRYDGPKLDAEATIKVLKALKDIKNHKLPIA